MDSLRENQREFITAIKKILKSQQRFRSNLLKKFHRIALGTDNDKRIKSTDSIGACSYGTMYKTDEIGKICKKGEIKSNSKIKHYKK